LNVEVNNSGRNSIFLVPCSLLIFKFLRILYINRVVAAVKVYDDGDSHGCFGRRYGNDEYGKENSVEPVGPQIFIEGDEIQVHTVQYQFHTHEHGYQVSPGKKTIHTDEEQCSTDEQ
jgi:hypothetical protein